MSKFDFEEIRKVTDTICEGKVLEVRAILKRGNHPDKYFKEGTYLGYFSSFEQVKTALTPFEPCHGNFYFTIQELKEELSSREQYNKFVRSGKNDGTSDSNVKRYRWLFIDFDPVRTSGISSTNEEKNKAVEVAQAVYDKLRLLGWGDPILCDSGNGCHLLYKIDLDNTKENSDLVKSVLNTLDVLFSTKDVSVDTGNFNASRICKLYGTLAMKGSNSDARPHRMSKILMIPDRMTEISAEMLQHVVALIPSPRKESRDYVGQATNFDELFNRWGVDFIKDEIINKNTKEPMTKYVFPVDPLNPEHNTSCSALFVFENGYPYFTCFHNSCTHTWSDIYKHYEGVPWDFSKKEETHTLDSLELTCLDDIEETEVEWLFPGRIPKGEITIFAGEGGTGKTSILCDIVASISKGNKSILDADSDIPEGWEERDSGKVLMFSSEDDFSKVLKGRLRKNDAYMKNVFTIEVNDERFKDLKFNSQLLDEILDKHRPTLCVFDPLQSFIPSDVNMSARNEMRNCLNALVGLGRKYGTTFIILMHTNKKSNVYGRQRMADSSDMWDIVRSVFLFGYADREGTRYISHEKSNYGRCANTILFSVVDGVATYKGTSNKKDIDYGREHQAQAQTPKRDDAKEIVLNLLSDAEDHTMEVKDLDTTAVAIGIAQQTLKRAKTELTAEGLVSIRNTGFGSSKKYFISLVDEVSIA